MFFDTDQFEWIPEIEAAYPEMLKELEALSEDDFKSWPERRYYNFGWKAFGLYAWGVRLDKNCKKCPITTKTLEKIPRLFNAGFSFMRPGTHIKPHHGFPEGVLRYHIGMIIPGKCGIRVGEAVRGWEAGKSFVFDDTMNHEAWNHSDKRRIILLVDFKAEHLCVHKPKYYLDQLEKEKAKVAS